MHPPQEALFGDRRIFVNAPQFHQHDYCQGAMDVDRDAKNQIMELGDRLHQFGCRTEAREMKLWGWVQDALRAPEVHQLVSQVEVSMEDATAKFAQDMYQYVDVEVVKLANELAALGTNLQDVQQNQVSKVQLQDLTTGGQVQTVDTRVTQLEGAYRLYVDRTVTVVQMNLQTELDGKVVMLKAELQQ